MCAEDSIKIGGRRFALSPLRVAHLMEIERHLLAEKKDPLEAIAARWGDFTDGQRRELLEAAFNELSRPPAVSLVEVVTWMNSPLGTAFAFWLAAREQDAALTWDACRELLRAAPAETLDEVQRLMAPELWERELGNCCGQAPFAASVPIGDACFAS